MRSVRAQAIELLAACQEKSRYFSGFDFQKLLDLAHELAVLRYEEGETVLCQGEPATFFGVVLEGALVPVIGEEPVAAPRGVGEILGEMALFQGGTRNVDVRATQDGYLAVFSFAQLDRLFATNASLASQLSRQLAYATLEKQCQSEGRSLASIPRAEIDDGVAALLERQSQQRWDQRGTAGEGGVKKEESLFHQRKTSARQSAAVAAAGSGPLGTPSARPSTAGGGGGGVSSSPSHPPGARSSSRQSIFGVSASLHFPSPPSKLAGLRLSTRPDGGGGGGGAHHDGGSAAGGSGRRRRPSP